MPLRNFFEALGDFFEWTFQILPILGDYFNWLIIFVIAGYGGYWLGQMIKHQRAGER